MIRIRMFGSLRLKCGFKETEADIDFVKEAVKILAMDTGWPEKEFKKCVVMVNGRQAKMSTRLFDGDELVFMSPSGGG